MSTLTKPRAKKAARLVRKSAPPAAKSVTLRAVDENDRLIPGYAAAYASVRPGVDLTKPTLRALPPAHGTAGDLLKDVKAGTLLKGADIALIEKAYKSRSSRRLRAA
jgi:hypothetical protein